MLIRRPAPFKASEITPRDAYLNRRRFLAGAAGLVLPAGAMSAAKLDNLAKSPFSTTTEKVSPLNAITGYNNFYEFGTGKEQPAQLAKNFKTDPWSVSVEGLVNKPKKFDLDQILKLAPLEERIYRMRCVEAWSIVVPWVGYSLSKLLEQVEPTAKAKYVAFESYYDAKQMPYGRFAGINLPYVEGLRLDEAMHPLTTAGDGAVRRNAAPAERRSGAAGRSMEVRLQRHQVDRQDQAGGEATALDVEHLEPE